jgi:DNA polymerase III sliding clamp (beta) subunit (PCNA family)
MKAAKATTSKEDYKPVLHGVFIETNKAEGAATFTSIDGYCLAQWTVPIEDISGDDCKAIVYPITIPGRGNMRVMVSVDKDMLSVTNTSTMITIQRPTIPGDYVDYKKIIPENRKDQYTFVNPRLLNQATTGFDGITNEPHTMKISISENKVDPIILSADNSSVKYTGIVLPIRIY